MLAQTRVWVTTGAFASEKNGVVNRWVVDIFDAHSKKLIFQGTDTKTLSGNPENNTGKLEKSVQDMFKKFPPPEKA